MTTPTQLDHDVIWMREHEGMQFKQIGRKLGVTKQRAHQIYVRAIRRINQPTIQASNPASNNTKEICK